MKLSEMIDYLKIIQEREDDIDPEFIVIIGNKPLEMKRIFSGKCEGELYCALEVDVPHEFKSIAKVMDKLITETVEEMTEKDKTKH
jgi:hypothetical protein